MHSSWSMQLLDIKGLWQLLSDKLSSTLFDMRGDRRQAGTAQLVVHAMRLEKMEQVRHAASSYWEAFMHL